MGEGFLDRLKHERDITVKPILSGEKTKQNKTKQKKKQHYQLIGGDLIKKALTGKYFEPKSCVSKTCHAEWRKEC